MNIVEAYIKFKGQLLIVVSGVSGTNKTKLAKKCPKRFKNKLSKYRRFLRKKDFNKKVTISDNFEIIDWDDIESYNWDIFLNEVDKLKNGGLVIVGPAFPAEKLENFTYIHLHIKISKNMLVENRHKYIETHPEQCEDLLKIINTDKEFLFIDKIVYKHYLEYVEKSKINKFFECE